MKFIYNARAKFTQGTLDFLWDARPAARSGTAARKPVSALVAFHVDLHSLGARTGAVCAWACTYNEPLHGAANVVEVAAADEAELQERIRLRALGQRPCRELAQLDAGL